MSDVPSPLNHLCAQMFLEPGRLVKAHRFAASRASSPRRGAPPHTHPDLLQFDLALGCTGHWMVDGQTYAVNGDTLAVFYPRQWHAYDVRAARAGACIWSLKVRVETAWPSIIHTTFIAHQTQTTLTENLTRAWERLIFGTNSHVASPVQVALRVCELLCLWPLAQGTPAPLHADPQVECAQRYLEGNLSRNVPLEELGKQVHLSSRQLARRFQQACGQSPRQWAETRRTVMARDCLLEGMLPVSEIARQLGFGSVQAFSRWFSARHGRGPRDWKRAGEHRAPAGPGTPFS